jgi:hypothetical protein
MLPASLKMRIGLLNRQCSFIKASGERCKGAATGPAGLCWAHAPENAEQRRRTASRAGRSKANRELGLIKEEIKAAIESAGKGDLDRNTARAMFTGWGVLLEYIKVERGAYLEDELAVRLEALKGERPHAS